MPIWHLFSAQSLGRRAAISLLKATTPEEVAQAEASYTGQFIREWLDKNCYTAQQQLLNQDDWFERMKTTARDTGNAMDAAEVANLSATIDIEALRAYRVAVGRRTREIVKQLQPEDLKQQVDPSRLQQMLDEGAVVEVARGLLDYWGKRNIAGLLLMPATRHNLVHLNEALRLKQRRK
jgi:tRNA A37 N6-isopentenylltransferase MiaA